MSIFTTACEAMQRQFGFDNVMSLATCDGCNVFVRHVNAYYKDGSIYVMTNKSTKKVKQITENPNVALCCGPFTAHGIAQNIGHPTKKKKNIELRNELKEVFNAFYERDVNENNSATCILKIDLTDAIIPDDGTKYNINFTNKKAKKT